MNIYTYEYLCLLFTFQVFYNKNFENLQKIKKPLNQTKSTNSSQTSSTNTPAQNLRQSEHQTTKTGNKNKAKFLKQSHKNYMQKSFQVLKKS